MSKATKAHLTASARASDDAQFREKVLARAIERTLLAHDAQIKQELESRLPKTFTVKTLNGLGHTAWAKATGKRLTLDTGKLGKLVTATAETSTFS